MTDTSTADLDALLAEVMLTPEGRADPYPRYASIREHVPAFRSAIGMVVLSRYDDCQWVLRDHRFGKGEPAPLRERFGLSAEEWDARFGDFESRMRSMLGMDPPDHTRLRRLVAKAFTPRTVEQLTPEIERLTDHALDGFGGGTVDVISQLALTLPIAVIGEMLGVPERDRAELQPLVRATVATLEFDPPLDDLDAAATAAREIIERFEQLIDVRRRDPTDDLLSELVHVEEQGEQLSHEELLATVMLLFGAGFETTTNLIGNGLLALLDHPSELQRLRDDRSLLGTGVDEMLRWDSPVQIDGRMAFEDFELHGIDLEAGEQVVTLLGSANRDPRKFVDPDRFDVGRAGAASMSFGAGIHYCLGAALARAEGYIVFDRLLDRFSVIEPAWGDEPPRHRESVVLRGLESLPVQFS